MDLLQTYTLLEPAMARVVAGAPEGWRTTLDKLEKEGKQDEAGRAAGDLAKEHPDKPAVQARERTVSGAQQAADARKIRKDSERGFLAAANDVSR